MAVLSHSKGKEKIMAWKNLQFHIRGVGPILSHNGNLARYDNPWSQAIKVISAKRKKVDADHVEMGRLEFHGGLYLGDNGPIIPAEATEACLIAGAKKFKEGMLAKSGMVVTQHADLIYDGPRDPDELWEDKRFVFQALVRVGMAKVLRTRPIFRDWSADVVIEHEDSIASKDRIEEWIHTAGAQAGLLEWRPRYGRFVVESMEELGEVEL